MPISISYQFNSIEWIRRQIYDLRAVLEEKGEDEVVAAADELDEKLIGVEENLIQMKLTGTGQDGVRWPAMLVGKLGHLAGAVSVADFPPTDQAQEVHAVLRDQLQRQRRALDEVLATDLAAFNGMLAERDLGRVVTEID